MNGGSVLALNCIAAGELRVCVVLVSFDWLLFVKLFRFTSESKRQF